MIRKVDLSKVPVKFFEPNIYLGTPMKFLVALIFVALSSLWLSFGILMDGFQVLRFIGVDLGGNSSPSTAQFAQVYLWITPCVAVAYFAYFFLKSKRVQITSNDVQIAQLPFSRQPSTYQSGDIVGVFCFPYRLQMGPLRHISRLYEMVQIVMSDGTSICLGYSTIPGTGYQYAKTCAKYLKTELKTFSPENIYNQHTYFYPRSQVKSGDTSPARNASMVPPGITCTSKGSTIQFQVKQFGKPPAQAVIVASLPIGLALLWHGSGGPWWGTALMLSIGLTVLAWHWFYRPSFNTDNIHLTSRQIVFLLRENIQDEIPLNEIDTIYLSDAGYHIPQALVISSKRGNRYFSGGLPVKDLRWLGTEISNRIQKASRYLPSQATATSTE